jgi:hypothetical protein
MSDYGGVNLAAWTEIFKLLGPSPVLRVGGASQDAMTEVPGPEVWAALVKLQRAINCRCEAGAAVLPVTPAQQVLPIVP